MIHTHSWNPPPGVPVRPNGVYLLHGIGEHAARYERLAVRLAAAGFRVAAHDHHGHGRSGGRRGVIDLDDRLVSDAAGQFERFAADTGATPFLFGHSLGGVVATELLLVRGLAVAGLVLSAPAIVPRLTRTDAMKLRLLSVLAPSLAVAVPYDANLLTHDPDEVATAHADELIHGFKSARLVRWLMTGARRAMERAPEIEVDTLVLVAGEDRLIDTEQTLAFAARLRDTRTTVHLHPRCHHELLNETPERRERAMGQIVDWLAARSA